MDSHKKVQSNLSFGYGKPGAKQTEDEKRRWLDKYFGPRVPVIFVHDGVEKFQHAKSRKHILIDDKEKVIKPWDEAGGTGILHTSAANTISQLRQLGLT